MSYTAVDNLLKWIADNPGKLSGKQALVGLQLARHIHSETMDAWPTLAVLAAEANCGRETLWQALDTLEAEGVIRRRRRTGRATVYEWVLADADTATDDIHNQVEKPDQVEKVDQVEKPDLPQVEKFDLPQVEKPDHIISKRTSKGISKPPYTHPPVAASGDEIEPPSAADAACVCEDAEIDDPQDMAASAGVDDGALFTLNTPTPTAAVARGRGWPKSAGDCPAFMDFWRAYPRKTARAAAYKAWQKATGTASPEELLSAAVAFATDPNLPAPRFIPHAATWLNGERWLDGPLPDQTAPATARDPYRAAFDSLAATARQADAGMAGYWPEVPNLRVIEGACS